MTDERIEGVMKKGMGHVQDAVGGLTGDAKTQAKGKLNEAAGSVQNAYGKVVDQAEDAFGRAQDQAAGLLGEVEDIIRAQPLTAAAAAITIGLVIGFLLHGGRKTVYVKR